MNFNKLFIYLFGTIFFTSVVHGTIVQKCETHHCFSCNKGPEPHYVNITNCEREPCQFPDGSIASMYLAFTVPKTSNKIFPIALATVVPGFPAFPYPLPDTGCESIVNGYCPVYEDEILLYEFNMPIAGFPAISFTLEFQLQADDKEIITCFKAKCAVVSS